MNDPRPDESPSSQPRTGAAGPATPTPAAATLPGTPTRRRALAVVVAAVLFGAAVQLLRPLPGTDAAGTIAYAAAAVGSVAVLMPRRGAMLPALIGTGLALGVEVFQLTGLPIRWAAEFAPIALLLGTSFDPADLVSYPIGGALAAAILAARRPDRV